MIPQSFYATAMMKVPLLAVYLAVAVLPLLAEGCKDNEEHHANLQRNLQEDRDKDGGVHFIYCVNYVFTITFPNISPLFPIHTVKMLYPYSKTCKVV